MNFNFGKKNFKNQNNIYSEDNFELNNKLNNIYESIQNIVFNEPKINKISKKEIKNNIEPILKKKEKEFKNSKNEQFIKYKKENIINNIDNNINDINNNYLNLKFDNYFELNKKNYNDNLPKKSNNNIEENFSFKDNIDFNKTQISNSNKNNKLTNKNSPQKENSINKEIIDFCKVIKTKSPNIFKINSFEKQKAQKDILRLKLEAFLVIKKYYLYRKSKSSWIKRKKKLIKLSDNFYRNLLLSRSFYGFVLNSKRQSLFYLIKNNYIDFRIKELSSLFIKSLKFCYQEKNKENKAFFILTKNKLRRVLNEMKAQMVYNKTVDKYLFAQIINNDAAVIFCKTLIYLGNSYNIKKLCRYESNINTIIHKEEFGLKQNLFFMLKNLGNITENKLNNEVDNFKEKITLINIKKKFILYLEEKIILNYKQKFIQQKLFFMRSKYYIIYKAKRKKTSPIYGPNKDLIKNFYKIKLKTLSLKILKKCVKKRKQKIEELQIQNFMKNVKFFFYQSRKKTIEALIIEGIKQKKNKYKRLMLMKILLYSKIECLKQYRVEISVRKKYQKKFLINILKKNILLKNYEKNCNMKFYFRLCFKLKINQIKIQKNKNELDFIKNMQKFFIRILKTKMIIKEKILKNKIELKNQLINIRKKYFIKEIREKIKKNKLNKIIYLKHDKIFSFAIGIINLKIKCNVELKIKINSFKKNKTRKYFNILKKRAIYRHKINQNKSIIKKYLLKKNFINFIQETKSIISYNKRKKLLNDIQKKFYFRKYLEGINKCYKMKLIDNKVDDYYKTKRKKCFLNILNKRYQNSIKYQMLSLRFNEYLIISAFNIFFKAINRNNNELSKIEFNNK